MGNKNKRYADERHKPDRGSNVKKRLAHDEHNEPDHQEPPERVGSACGNAQSQERDGYVEKHKRRRAEKAELFGGNGKNRISYRFRKIRELFYALPEPAPSKTAGADGDELLLYLVARAERVCFLVDKGFEPLRHMGIFKCRSAEKQRPQ